MALDIKHFGVPHIIVCLNVYSYHPLPSRFCAIQMEQTCANTNWFTPRYIADLKKAEAVFDYSHININELRKQYNIDAIPIQLGPIPIYQCQPPSVLPKHVMLYGIMNERRYRWVMFLKAHGVPIVVLRPTYGHALRKTLVENARLIVNIHYYENALLEQCRLFECTSLGIPVISETSVDMPLSCMHALSSITFVPVNDMGAMLHELMRRYNMCDRRSAPHLESASPPCTPCADVLEQISYYLAPSTMLSVKQETAEKKIEKEETAEKKIEKKAETEEKQDKTVDMCLVISAAYQSMSKMCIDVLQTLGLQAKCVSHYNKTKPNESCFLFVGQVHIVEPLPTTYIVWQTEHETESSPFSDQYRTLLSNAMQVWYVSPHLLLPLTKLSLTTWYVPFPFYKEAIKAKEEEPKEEEPTLTVKEGMAAAVVLFYGEPTPRQQAILDELITLQYTVRIVKTPAERCACFHGSEGVVLNLKCHEHEAVNILHIHDALYARRPIVSEYISASETCNTMQFAAAPVYYVDQQAPPTEHLQQMLDMVFLNLKNDAYANVKWDAVYADLFTYSKYMIQRTLLSRGGKGSTFPFEYPFASTFFNPPPLYCLHVPETPNRLRAFLQHPTSPPPRRYQIIPGIKAEPGWKGCALSYYNIIWNAKRHGLAHVAVFEDDCAFPEHFESVLHTIYTFLDARSSEWDIFNGCIASLPETSQIQALEQLNDIQFVQVDKMHSMVFNIYNQSVYDRILEWDIHTVDQRNQIDQYIKHLPGLRIITTHPFQFGCLDVESTLWDRNMYEEYAALIKKSSDRIERHLHT
jgi:hypothetical protein